jgi:hypothetical protein
MKKDKKAIIEDEILIESQTETQEEIAQEEIKTEEETPQEEIKTEEETPQEEIKTEEETPQEEIKTEEETPQEEIPVKNKRGRKAGGKNKPKEIPQEEIKTEEESEEIKKDIYGKKPENKKQEEKKTAEPPPPQLFAVSGEMLLGAIDFTAPLLITTAGGFFDKDIKKIKVESLQLDETEKKALLPAAEAVAKENIRLSAMEMLLSGLLIIYTGKIYQAVKTIKTGQ